ncbi:hypothetical protein D3C73_740520 [compost metagenome]
MAVSLEQVGECHRATFEANHRDAEMLQVIVAESAEGEAFLTHVLAGQPCIGNHFQLIHRRLARFVDFQRQAVAGATVPGVTQVLHLFALGFQVKAKQIDPGFFAEFDRGQADVHVVRQVLRAHLVEHRASVVNVTKVAELPDHFGALLAGADRVVQRHQAAATACVHQERFVILVKQQRLVTGQREATVGLRRCHQNLRRAIKFVRCRQVNDRARGAQQPGQRDHQQQHGSAKQRTQATRGVSVEGELPPQLMAVRHVLIGEQQQPRRSAQHAEAGHQIQGGEGQFGQAARAIERATEHTEQGCGEGHQRRFFPVEAFKQREQGADQQQNGGQHPRRRQAPAQALGQHQAEHADQAGAEVRGVDQTMRDQKADVFQTCIDLGRRTRKQQHHAGQEHQHRQNRRGQTRRGAHGLGLKQALTFVDQQEYAGHQQRQHHVDQAIQQQRRGQWCGT